jgi:hypothetical protein
MRFGPGIEEVFAIDFAQRHRPLDWLRLGQLRSFGFVQLEHGPKHSARLDVTVSPPPAFDELSSALHVLVIDTASADLRPRGTEQRDFPRVLVAHDAQLCG